MSMIQPAQPAPTNRIPEDKRFDFADTFEDQEAYYDEMQEEVELHMLRQGHGVRRSPRLYDER